MMDETYDPNLYSHCCCCLSSSEETSLGIYALQNKTLKTTLQTKQLTLCVMCKRVAKKVEKFIRNVELNQPYFEYKKNKPDWEVSSNNENITPARTPQDGDNNDDINSSFNDPEFNLFLEKELNDIIGVATHKKNCLNREIGVQVNENSLDSITMSLDTRQEQTALQEDALNNTVIPFDSINTDVVVKKSAHEPIEFTHSRKGSKINKTLINNITTPFSTISSDLEALANENSIDNIPTPYFNSIDSEIDIQDTTSCINLKDAASCIELAAKKVEKSALSSKKAENLMDQQSDIELNEISSYILDKGKALITQKMSKINTKINLHVTAKAIYDPIIPYDDVDTEVVPQGSENSMFDAVTSLKNMNMELDLQVDRKAQENESLFDVVTSFKGMKTELDLHVDGKAQESEKSIFDAVTSLNNMNMELNLQIDGKAQKSEKSIFDAVTSLKNMNMELDLQVDGKAHNSEKSIFDAVTSFKDMNAELDLQVAGKAQGSEKSIFDAVTSLKDMNAELDLLLKGKAQGSEKSLFDAITSFKDMNMELDPQVDGKAQGSEKSIFDAVTSFKNMNTELDIQGKAMFEPLTYDINTELKAQENEKPIYNTEISVKYIKGDLKVNAETIFHEDGKNFALEPQENVGNKALSLKSINTEICLHGKKSDTLGKYDNANTELVSQKIAQKHFDASETPIEDLLIAELLQVKDKCAYSTDKSLLLSNENGEIDLLINTNIIHKSATPYDDIIHLESVAQQNEKNIDNAETALEDTNIEIMQSSENAIYEPVTPYEDIVSEAHLSEKAIYTSAVPLKSVLTKIDAQTRNEGKSFNENTDQQFKGKAIYNTPVETVKGETETLENKDTEINLIPNKIKEPINVNVEINLTPNKIEETINVRKEDEIDVQTNRKPVFKTPTIGIDIQSKEKPIFKTPTPVKSINKKLVSFDSTSDNNAENKLSKKKISTHISERGHKYCNLNFNAEIEKKIEVMKRLLAEIPEHEKIDSPIEQMIDEIRNVPAVSENPETFKVDEAKKSSKIPLNKRIHIIEDIRIYPTETIRQNLLKTCAINREMKIKKPRKLEEIENSSEILENVNVLRIIEEMKKVDSKPESPMTYFRNKVMEFNRKKADMKTLFNDSQIYEAPLKIVYLTEEQCIEERRRKSEEKIYLASKFKCENCIRGFSTKTTLDNHLATHSMIGEHECQFCKQKFKSQPMLKVHYKLHLRRFKCSKCEFMKSSRCVVKDHYKLFHCEGPPAYECPRCGIKYSVKQSLVKHIKSKHVNVTYPCPHCDKIYTLKQSLTVHLIGRHPNHVGLEPGKQFVCETCNQGFTSSSSLSNHRRTHGPDQEFNCVECNKLFKTKSALTKHLSSSVKHASIRFTCDYCGEKFPLKTKLLRHIYEHLGKKPYPCSVCNKGYYILSKVKDHMRSAHKGFLSPRDISCHVCHKMFQSKKILNVHLRIHTGETPYKCDKCPAKFTSTGSLSNHKKMVHLGWKRRQNKIVNVNVIT